MLDYYRHPARQKGWGGPFNAQEARTSLFSSLVKRVQPAAIIETGTYLGTTTAHMAAFGRPVFTIEADPRVHGFAKTRLRKWRNVNVLRGDSPVVLHQLFDGPFSSLCGQPLLFYLDAHWKDELPLAKELEIIFGRSKNPIVMIDDFQVADDPGYTYDDYGAGYALTLAYIAPVIAAYGLATFYPSTPSAHETGARRGCVVLARREYGADVLGSISLLRSAPGA